VHPGRFGIAEIRWYFGKEKVPHPAEGSPAGGVRHEFQLVQIWFNSRQVLAVRVPYEGDKAHFVTARKVLHAIVHDDRTTYDVCVGELLGSEQYSHIFDLFPR